ncbi:MAG TPA: ABC transporter substrate-binding protein, partial [Acidimicrobiales bacterium]
MTALDAVNRTVDSGAARAAAVIAAVLLLVAASCQGGALTGADAIPTFRVGTAQPASLDPVLASQPQETLVARQLFDGLVRYDDTTAAVAPDVATSWEIDATSTVFTFHLRARSRFSDGEYVTAASFVRGMTRALTPAVYRAPGSLGYELDGIAGAADVVSGRSPTLSGARALDPLTLEIRLSAPDAQFLVRCGDVAFSPLPSAAAVAARQPSWARFPLGNGPFKLSRPMVANQAIVLTPNALHAGGHPKVAQVALEIYNDVAASYAAWRAGRLDWSAYPPDRMAEVRRHYRSSSVIRPTAGLDGLVLDEGSAPASNPLFRQAVSLAVDRAAIARGVLANAVLPAAGLVPALVPGAAAGGGASPCPSCGFDPAR